MTAYQDEQSLGTISPYTWASPTYQPASWCFNHDGTEVWQVYFRNYTTGLVRPRMVRLAWPSLAVVDSFVFDWYQGGPGEPYEEPVNTGYYLSGRNIACYDEDTVVVARYTTTNTSFPNPQTVHLDVWEFGDSVGTEIANLDPAASSTGQGWDTYGVIWDPTRAAGLLFTGERGATASTRYQVWKATPSGLTLVDSSLSGFRFNGDVPGYLAADGTIHYSFQISGDGSTSYRVGIYDLDTDTLTESTVATSGWDQYPGLDNVGTLPFGDGMHYYVEDPMTFDVQGFDLGDIDDPGTGTLRTVDNLDFAVSVSQRRVNIVQDHTIGGTFRSTGNGSTATHQYYEMYRVGTPDVPVVGGLTMGMRLG